MFESEASQISKKFFSLTFFFLFVFLFVFNSSSSRFYLVISLSRLCLVSPFLRNFLRLRPAFVKTISITTSLRSWSRFQTHLTSSSIPPFLLLHYHCPACGVAISSAFDRCVVPRVESSIRHSRGSATSCCRSDRSSSFYRLRLHLRLHLRFSSSSSYKTPICSLLSWSLRSST